MPRDFTPRCVKKEATDQRGNIFAMLHVNFLGEENPKPLPKLNSNNKGEVTNKAETIFQLIFRRKENTRLSPLYIAACQPSTCNTSLTCL